MPIFYEVKVHMPDKPAEAREITDLFFEYNGRELGGDPEGTPNFTFVDKKDAVGFLEKAVDLPYVKKISIISKKFG